MSRAEQSKQQQLNNHQCVRLMRRSGDTQREKVCVCACVWWGGNVGVWVCPADNPLVGDVSENDRWPVQPICCWTTVLKFRNQEVQNRCVCVGVGVCVSVGVLASSLLGILPKELWCLPCITTQSNHLYQLSACWPPSFLLSCVHWHHLASHPLQSAIMEPHSIHTETWWTYISCRSLRPLSQTKQTRCLSSDGFHLCLNVRSSAD